MVDVNEPFDLSLFDSLEVEKLFVKNNERINNDIALYEYFEEDKQLALLGMDPKSQKKYFLNTSHPFCALALGLQGSGKSHTVGCLLESCLVPYKLRRKGPPIVKLLNPMNALVLHYDSSPLSECEIRGLLSPNPDLPNQVCFDSKKTSVVLSNSYFDSRKDHYNNFPDVAMKRLLFRWSDLTADNIRTIMRVNESSPLYVTSMFNILRNHGTQGKLPPYRDFKKEVERTCTVPGQRGPLQQRLDILESLIVDCPSNEKYANHAFDFSTFYEPSHLTIMDLTDPFLSAEDANAIFQIIVEKFQKAQPPSTAEETTANKKKKNKKNKNAMVASKKVSKLLMLDEAHKYLSGVPSDMLTRTLVSAARLMRHDGLRLIIGTQSPLSIANELIELMSIVFVHRFHSIDWFNHLHRKVPLSLTQPVSESPLEEPVSELTNNDIFRTICELDTGTAMVFSSKIAVKESSRKDANKNVTKSELQTCKKSVTRIMSIRQRITMDMGVSIINE